MAELYIIRGGEKKRIGTVEDGWEYQKPLSDYYPVHLFRTIGSLSDKYPIWFLLRVFGLSPKEWRKSVRQAERFLNNQCYKWKQ